jgi:uncharacterized protein YjlB
MLVESELSAADYLHARSAKEEMLLRTYRCPLGSPRLVLRSYSTLNLRNFERYPRLATQRFVKEARVYAIDSLKGSFERITGIARPSARQASALVKPRKAWASRFKDDGSIPNNPTLPFIRYRSAVHLSGAADPAAVFEVLFETNGWGGSWRNGVYNFVHYHPRTHEVLGIARGRARVRFGGAKGKLVELKAGDIVILPAGTGHQAIKASKDLLVVGAYPPLGKYEEYKGSAEEHAKAVRMVSKVRLPARDPAYGKKGPLKHLWHRSSSARMTRSELKNSHRKKLKK